MDAGQSTLGVASLVSENEQPSMAATELLPNQRHFPPSRVILCPPSGADKSEGICRLDRRICRCATPSGLGPKICDFTLSSFQDRPHKPLAHPSTDLKHNRLGCEKRRSKGSSGPPFVGANERHVFPGSSGWVGDDGMNAVMASRKDGSPSTE